MKNYIANEAVTTTTGQRIATSSAYIRQELELAIREGRQGKNDENRKYEAFRHLGAALHTLEGIIAYHVLGALGILPSYDDFRSQLNPDLEFPPSLSSLRPLTYG